MSSQLIRHGLVLSQHRQCAPREASEITQRLGRQDIDVIALYTGPAQIEKVVLQAEVTTDPPAQTEAQRGALVLPAKVG